MHYRLLLGLVFFFGITTVYANSNKLVANQLEFNQYDIRTPFKVSLPVIAVELVTNDQPAIDEIVLIGEDDSNKTWLAAYVFEEKTASFVLLDIMELSDAYFSFDVSEHNQGLYFLSKNSVVSLRYNKNELGDKKSNSGLFLEHIQNVKSIFLLDEASFIAQNDFIQDLNNDQLDDIILPDFEHTHLWLSSKNSQQLSHQQLPIVTNVELSGEGVNFKPLSLFLADFNVDERQDLAWVSQGSINYFSQNSNGTFAQHSNKISLSDNIYGLNWWQITEADGESPDQSNLTHRVVEEIKDINGDGLADVIVRFTQSSGVLDRVNDYEFYLGFQTKDKQLAFPSTANTVIKAEGTLTDLKIVDVNEDNKFEVLLSSFELSVSNIIGALLSGGIDQNVLLFALNDENSYGSDALISKEVELNFSLSSGQSGQPIVLLSDVNGDKAQDLILSSGEEKLSIFLGNHSSGLFNRKSSNLKMHLPKNGALFNDHDINHDGKADFIMRYGRLDDESMANKVTIHMVK